MAGEMRKEMKSAQGQKQDNTFYCLLRHNNPETGGSSVGGAECTGISSQALSRLVL